MKFFRLYFFLTFGLLLVCGQAQEGLPAVESDPSASTTFLEVFQSAGMMLYPLAALSIAAVFLIIFYLLTIRQGAVVSDKFMNSADALIRKQDYLGLLAVCNRHNEAIARITEKTLDFATKNPTATFDEVREVTESEGTRQASLLNQRITYLADIGSIAPMVGLLGTVIGMIKSFAIIGTMSVMGDRQNELASGVSEALLTTAGGLMIGIPAMIFYSIFRGRVQRLIAEMEAAATYLSALLASQYKRALPVTQPGMVPAQGPAPQYQQELEPDYFSEYSMRDRTIDPQVL
ncbi:MAG: biopolymer transport protein ExbB [Verrucomicrobiales bacterium]|jgi:biopolymer transport protein ExbB